MTLSRTLVAFVLASFLAGGIVPQPGLVAHDHDGGAIPHVHVGPLVSHRHAGHCHVHADDGGAVLVHPRHVHRQHPFQHVDRAAPPALARAERAIAAVPASPPAPAEALAAPARSRGPPAPRA
jgi:hypothetical protein